MGETGALSIITKPARIFCRRNPILPPRLVPRVAEISLCVFVLVLLLSSHTARQGVGDSQVFVPVDIFFYHRRGNGDLGKSMVIDIGILSNLTNKTLYQTWG